MAIIKKDVLLNELDKKTLEEVAVAEKKINRELEEKYCGKPLTIRFSSEEYPSEKAMKELEKRLAEAGFSITDTHCSRDCSEYYIKIN